MGKYKINISKRSVKSLQLSSKKLLKTLVHKHKTHVNFIRNSKIYHWLDPLNYQGLERTLHSIGLLVMAGLLLFSAISPVVDIYVNYRYYSLNSKTSSLVGNVSKSLANQITYDSQQQAYIFNADGKSQMSKTIGPDKVPLSLLKAKVGGGNDNSRSLYAVQLPTDPKQGISYYDTNTGLSFQMVPNFTQMSAKQIDNHIVYPINKDMQMVYSVKNNGLKEDIVLKKFVSDSLIYRYSLKLPQTLEARMLTDGSGDLGIYSADPALFTHSTYGSDYDPAKIESAQLHARKDHLVFAIPAPVIKGTGDRGQGTASANFGLSNDGSTLTVSADHLKGLHYPVSIDPTVVIASTSDFAIGNNEDNNITYPANQISRGSVTGGSISNSGGWTATTALSAATYYATSVTYNGYAYEIGGYIGAATANVYYAPLNANGTVSAWTATTALPVATYLATSVAYNGYVYVIGGSATSLTAAIYYAPINANGTVGAWTATTPLTTGTREATSVAYNGYLYEIGGWDGTGNFTTVAYAPINANGTIGVWTATTALPIGTRVATSVVYNGYLYEIGGCAAACPTTAVYYAPINANGTVGAWTATTALPSGTYNATSVVYNGYLYEIGGYTTALTTTVSYAPINANGSIGAWTATNTLPIATDGATSVAYSGYLYEIGGYNGSAAVTTVNYAKIDPAGTTTAYTATTALPAATDYSSSVAYNGYLYEIGGDNSGGSAINNVYYASINSNGTIGSWTSTTVLPTATVYATSVAYNGYLYVIGGDNGSATVATVYYASINSDGTIGSWTSTTVLPTATEYATSVAYNGYLYEIGGDNSLSGAPIASVYYTQINSNGTLGSWTATTSLPVATYNAGSVTYNGYLYEIGGYTTTSSTISYFAQINNDGTIANWSATTAVPVANQAATTTVYNGYLYEIGGHTTVAVATVYYAPINTNGTIGSWTSTTVLPTATEFATSVVYNGYLYEIGGDNSGSAVASVYFARINNGGPGTAGAWTANTSLPVATRWATSVTYNGYLYEIGGATTAITTNVYYAPINANGAIGTWTATTSLPTATQSATSVTYNGYLYVIGGYNGSVAVNTVYYAPINANGTIGAWTATTSLPAITDEATSVAYNGYVYEVGGGNGSAYVNTVYYAPINVNGTIGAWTATTSLPATIAAANSVIYNGYLYEIGGYTGSGTPTVYYAPINANGTIGAWTATTSLPTATWNSSTVAYNGYLYEIGGATITAITTTVYYAPINANGTIGAWTATTSLPTATQNATSVTYNGYLYEIGGNTTAATATVDYAPINVMPRVGHYSQMFNFGSLITPVSISYNGNLPKINGLSSIQYKIAGSNAVLGSSQYSSVLTGTSAACNTIGAVQYVFANITLDDSGSAAFPDVLTTPANVSDFTVTYTTVHPPPNLRMRNGTYFSNGIIQPMDTCALVPIPNQPTIGTATDSGVGRAYNNGSAVVSFTPSAGGYAATSYTVTSSTGGFSATGTSSPLTVTGLQSGVAYTFTVTASNAIGSSYTSSASNSITATTVPQPVTIGTATNTGSGRPYNNGLATVGFTPGGTGGLAATYVATASAGGYTGSGGSSPVTVAGLQSGGSYTFTVVASNANGSAVASSASNSITATTIPQAPTIGTATNSGAGRPYNNGLATVGYTANATGGASVTYTATASVGGYSASGGSPISVTGMQSATAYSFTVTATNANGSATSASSNTITATTVPQAPTIGTVTDVGSGRAYNNGLATVAFTDNATGGSAITGHTATASAGGYNGSGGSPISVAGQQSGVGYTYTVTATNANGTSAASSSSGSVTATTIPQAPTIGTATTTGNHTASVGYTPNGTGGLGVTYTASPGSGSGGSPIAVSGLNAVTSYSFTVTASNANGSATSGASNSITTTGAIVTGGTRYSDGTYYYQVFRASDTLGITGSLTADVLTIAGGGHGGEGGGGGATSGGGAGGVLYSPGQVFTSGKTVTVGAGGGAAFVQGANSSVGVLVAIGGGFGTYTGNGGSGGSGGGGAGTGGTGGAGTAGQGNKGGDGVNPNPASGGGAGAAGQIGIGGAGTSVYSTWASATGTGVSGYYAGGGGNGTNSGGGGSGGSGGGGNGGGPGGGGGNGTANTGGGGGGGGSFTTTSTPGGTGGSGIVIVRYLISAV